MSDKYIIRNCPAYNINTCSDSKVKEQYCSKCTDCVMKQIVEKCMEDWEDIVTDRFQRELLDLLDIQEVE